MPVDAPVADPAHALRWANRYAALGDAFHTRLAPLGVPDPHWVATSDACAALLGLPPGWDRDARWNSLAVLAGNASWPGTESIATVYSGHQFGVWAGQLGDGRAHLLGELDTPHGPMEIQLKGAGLTPYSRMGDGRAVLRSSIREFLCSEAMAALGIPTTRALAVVGSPLPVRRERIETAAVATRVAPSFLRFGHFEHFAHHDQHDALRKLADFAIDAYFPECRETDQPFVALLDVVSRRTATLLAEWQAVGFCHGVMNTDNMSLLGLTIDYGPFGFLDAFDPGHVCNHSDTQGRYAYARQPNVAFWNLHALAQALLPLIGDEEAAVEALAPYKSAFPQALMGKMRDKLGLLADEPGDQALIDDLLRRMAADRADFTIVFRRLSRFSSAPGAKNDGVRDLFLDREAFDAWAPRYSERLRREASIDSERAVRMDIENPKIVLRNHLAENAIRAAEGGDFGEVRKLHAALLRPYDDTPVSDAYAGFPPEWAAGLEVSCSS